MPHWVPIIASVLAPLLVIADAIADHFGWWDRITGRADALAALERLRSGSGYPHGFLYDDALDQPHFRAIEKRVTQRTRSPKLLRVLGDGHRPSMITIAGDPVALDGVPPDWPQTERIAYLPDHPVLASFGMQRNGQGKGKAARACSLSDLERWLDEERSQRQLWISNIALGLLALAITLAVSGPQG